MLILSSRYSQRVPVPEAFVRVFTDSSSPWSRGRLLGGPIAFVLWFCLIALSYHVACFSNFLVIKGLEKRIKEGRCDGIADGFR